MKLILGFLILSLAQACAFYPKAKYHEDNARCDLMFKKLTMEVTHSRIECHGGGDTAAACIILAGAVAGGSVVVSGSIVLVGNTLHWLEKQGKCDDSFLNTRILKHNTPLLEDDGVLMEDGEDLENF